MITRRGLVVGAAAVGTAALLGACADRGLPPVVTGRLDSPHWPQASPRWRLALPEGARATVVALHGHGGDADAWFDPPIAAGLAAEHGLAVAAVDGGDTYWHAREDGTDTGAMVLDHLLPALEQAGAPVDQVGFTGFSMGGYGALLLATQLPPARVLGVAAISSALFLSADETAPGAFDDAADFARHDVFARLEALRALPVWLACGADDSFAEANARLADALPGATAVLDDGGHDRTYLETHWPTGMEFLAQQVGAPPGAMEG